MCYCAESDWRCFRGCAISSSYGRCGILFPGGWGQIQGCKKVPDFFIPHLQSIVFTVTSNAQNTLQHFQGEQVPSKHFFSSKGAPVFVKGEAPVPWHDGQSKPVTVTEASCLLLHRKMKTWQMQAKTLSCFVYSAATVYKYFLYLSFSEFCCQKRDVIFAP